MKKSSTFSYVILHYKNLKDTIECILSIQKNSTSSIVVVDNATLSNSDEQKLKKYTKDIIKLEENLGFAKANNIGCKYAITKYRPDFLVVINNDIVITQKDFESRILDIYQSTSFDMLGPKIITCNGNSVNPFPVYKNIVDVEEAIQKTQRNIRLFQSGFKYFCFSIYHNLKYKFKKMSFLENGDTFQKDVALHGCALIFSKKYYEKYDDVFYNETFLYHEEEFLYYRTVLDDLVSCYDPSIELFHKEGASLNLSYDKRNREKELFRNQEILKSLTLLYSVMKEGKKI